MVAHINGPAGWLASMLEPEVEFRRQVFSNYVCEHISAVDKGSFIKFGVYVRNGVPQRAE